jgi:hypothetical protein
MTSARVGIQQDGLCQVCQATSLSTLVAPKGPNIIFFAADNTPTRLFGYIFASSIYVTVHMSMIDTSHALLTITMRVRDAMCQPRTSFCSSLPTLAVPEATLQQASQCRATRKL